MLLSPCKTIHKGFHNSGEAPSALFFCCGGGWARLPFMWLSMIGGRDCCQAPPDREIVSFRSWLPVCLNQVRSERTFPSVGWYLLSSASDRVWKLTKTRLVASGTRIFYLLPRLVCFVLNIWYLLSWSHLQRSSAWEFFKRPRGFFKTFVKILLEDSSSRWFFKIYLEIVLQDGSTK